MNRALDSALRFLALTGIVATMLCVPVGGLLAALGYVFLGITPYSFLTFGGRLLAPVGLVAWWALAWLPAAIYTALCPRD